MTCARTYLLAATAFATLALTETGRAQSSSGVGSGTAPAAEPYAGSPQYPPQPAYPSYGWRYPPPGYPHPPYDARRYANVHQYPRPAYPPAYPPAGPLGQEPEPTVDESGVTFDVSIGTTFPIDLGPQLTLEVPGRVLMQLELGWLPGGYGSAIVGLIDAFGKETAVLGPAIEDSLANSFVARASLGWRPFSDYGFEVWGGYTHLSIAGSVSPDIVDRLVDGPLGDRVSAEITVPLDVDAKLHNFHVGLGWRFLALDDKLVFRALLGYTQTVAAASSLQIGQDPALESQVRPLFEDTLDEVVTRDVKLPLLGLTAGYRF